MKKLKRLIVVACAVLMFVSSAYATVTKTKVGGCPFFNGAWERTVDICVGPDSNHALIGTMVYGYDTDWINEDYTWTFSESYSSRAEVKNNTTYENASYKFNGWSKAEITHHGSNTSEHEYGITFNTNAYSASELTMTSPKVSNVK